MLLIATTVVSAVVFGGIGYLLGGAKDSTSLVNRLTVNTNTSPSTSMSSTSSTTSTSITAAPNEIANWKTYTNDQYGITARYPDDFNAKVIDPKVDVGQVFNVYFGHKNNYSYPECLDTKRECVSFSIYVYNKDSAFTSYVKEKSQKLSGSGDIDGVAYQISYDNIRVSGAQAIISTDYPVGQEGAKLKEVLLSTSHYTYRIVMVAYADLTPNHTFFENFLKTITIK